MPAGIDQKVEIWKNKLLDLGKRNRLINYRETKRSTLSIKTPEIFELWESFVENDNPLEFPYYREPQEETDVEYDIDNGFLTSSDVTTNQNVKELQRTLRNLRNKAKMAIEEQGINILYLAFGFLKWTEADYSTEQIVSPLLLVPVSLTVESISSPFVLQMTDDEIVVNPALKYKMENDFGLTFPEFDEDLGLQNYLNAVQKAVKNNNWTVTPEVGLSLFSFLKINMYSDLARNKENVVSNPIVRTIAGDTSAAQHIPEELNDYDFDKKLKPVDVFQVVDADSSQQEAILCAKKGVSFVLQGPPGTGKSQTITNIIAECLADGKKVLFVSEKMAALDVVHKRLTSAGLDDFCLVLHSHKANKKAVLEQLRKALSLARNKAQLSDEAYMKLETLYQDKEKLNQYAEQIFETVSPLNMTIYQVNGTLAELDDYPDVIFSIPDIRSTSAEQYRRYLYVLNAFKNTIGKMSEDFNGNPWRGSIVPVVTNELRHDVSARFPALASSLSRCASQANDIFSSVYLTFEHSYENLKKGIDLLAVAKKSPGIPYSWISEPNVISLFNGISVYEEKTSGFARKLTELQSQYAVINGQGICELEPHTFADLDSVEKICGAKEMLSKCAEGVPELLRMQQQAEDLALIQNERQIAEGQARTINAIKGQISQDFAEGIFDIDYKVVLSRYHEAYSSLTNALQENYYPGISVVSRPDDLLPEQWIQAENLIQLSSDAQTYEQRKETFQQKAAELKKLYDVISATEEQLTSNADQLVTFEALEAELQKLHAIIAGNSAMSAIDTGKLIEACRKELLGAQQKADKIHSMQSDLLQNFEKEVLGVNYQEMLVRYKLQYTSILKYVRGSYYADQRQMKLLYRNVSQKIDDKTIIAALTTLQDIGQTREDMGCECKNLMEAFGDSFQYEDTDFQNISMVLDTYANLLEAIRLVSDMMEIVQDFDPADSELAEKYGVWYKGIDTSWELVLLALQKTADFRQKIRNEVTVFQPYYKNDTEELSEHAVIKVLLALRQLDAEREKCNVVCPHFIFVFDAVFEYENTDFKLVDALLTTYTAFIQAQSILVDMDAMMQELNLQEADLREQYGFFYEGMATSWQDIRDALDWTIEFKKEIDKYQPNDEFVKCICSGGEIIKKCGTYQETIANALRETDKDFQWFLSLFGEPELYAQMDLQVLANRIQRCANGLFLLEEWIDFVNARKDCEKEGLFEYVQQIEEQKIKPYQILPIFQKRFFRLWLDAVLPEYPAVLNFRRLNQENTIREFCELDRMQFEIAKARIKSKLINDLPLLDKFTSGMDEVGILKRELGKQRKIMPIRKLFRHIPNLLLVLKPCLMMSPLSVSLFLEADTYQFDTVIFDEASQVCTENAIGAIARGKQVVIAGDSKQLPPTSFFSASTSDTDDYDTDDEEDDDSAAYESILDEANLLPERTLLWHYRSRHEHLIAFSNAKIYHNNLITFPSNVDRVPDNGVEYFYVKEGFYDRGGKKGNVPEAKRVAELVFEHFKKHPNRSLGVIAFGEVQQQAIETMLREMRLRNQQYERFFNEEKEDAFFIKNLENVQGDERDTIIFSVGYAKDAAGVFRMNFGPLSKSGGERRLNVAITRAKYNVKLVGSILPTDIDVDRVSAEGPKLLRSYIDFAINGIDSLQREVTESDIVQHDSPFEKAVYDFLDRKGYKLATQVGCSGYRIDMAVKHPTISGQYVLGIECDGAAYHSAKTARERDRLRQDVLENMGWKIYRIWSTDWIKDPVTEGNRLIEAIEDALKNYGIDEPVSSKVEVDAEDFVSLEEKAVSIEDIENPYGFEGEQQVSFAHLSRNSSGYLSGADCIMEIVNRLYPVHYDLICQHLAPLLGNTKATVKVKREVDYQLQQLGKKLIRKGDFFFPAGYTKVSPRVNSRKINHISTEELAEAMYRVLSKSVGLTKELLCAETARAYNFHRMTQNITSAINEAFELLVKQERIEIIEGKVSISK